MLNQLSYMKKNNSINNITIIGAGMQEHKLAQTALIAGFNKVFLYSRTKQSIERAVDKIINSKSEGLKVLESKNLLEKGSTTQLLLSRLVKEPNLRNAVKDTEFIIEAVPEIMTLKQKIFKKMSEYCPNHTIIASDTSTMSITKIAKYIKNPNRVIGMHFFNPLRSPLIEITKGKYTTDNTMDIAYNFAKSLPCENGERVVIKLEKESPGFIVNRMIGTIEIYFKWAIEQATRRNIPYEQIDADIISVMPMGCCLMCDIMGIDTIYYCMKYFASNLSPDFKPTPIFKNMIDQGRLGKKSGKGFYDWSKGKPIIDRKKKAGIINEKMIKAILLNEGCKLLEKRIVNNYDIIGEAVLAGYNISGPFEEGKRNYKELSKLLDNFSKKTDNNYLKPCDLMKSGNFRMMTQTRFQE